MYFVRLKYLDLSTPVAALQLVVQTRVGRDDPAVSLGTYSKFTEYIAAVRGQIWPCRMNIRKYTLYWS